MTGFTDIGCGWMIARFAGSNSSVMTADTGANDVYVIQRRDKWQPGIWWRAVAGIAYVGGVGVCAWFAFGYCIVMTACATSDDL